jgi:hypothetical protein
MFENCPYRYYRQRVRKDIKEYFESDAESFGVKAHKRLEQRLMRKRPLPEEIASCEQYCRELEVASELHVEYQMALNNRLDRVDWFSPDAWSRAAADVLAKDGSEATIVDWKTGKVRYDDLQGIVLAFHTFACFPDVTRVRTRFIFVRHGVEKGDVYDRSSDLDFIWGELKDRLQEIKWAQENDCWPKKRTGLCAWCPVKDCEHWRER